MLKSSNIRPKRYKNLRSQIYNQLIYSMSAIDYLEHD